MSGFLRLVGIAGFIFLILAIAGLKGGHEQIYVFQELELTLIVLCVLVALGAASIIENQQALVKVLKGEQAPAPATAAEPVEPTGTAPADRKGKSSG